MGDYVKFLFESFNLADICERKKKKKTNKQFFGIFQVTGKQVLPIYHKEVERSYFNSSDKVKQ